MIGQLRARYFAMSPPLARRLTGPLVELDGNTLDRQAQLLLFALRQLRWRLTGAPAAVARRRYEASARLGDRVTRPAPRLLETRYPGPTRPLRARLLYPDYDAAPRPAILYFHGGGFAFGSVDTVDGLCHRLLHATGAVVVNVDYRLAPETPMPGAPEDCYAAFAWLVAEAARLGIDPARIAVAGDSAGGNLAAVVCQLARLRGPRLPAFQLLLYPSTHAHAATRSRTLFERGFLLEARDIAWFHAQYVPRGLEDDPRGSPLLCRSLAGLPPAHVVTAGFDPLRDEGHAYAEALAAAGVPVSYACERSLIHGFASMDVLQEGVCALDRAAAIVRAALFSQGGSA